MALISGRKYGETIILTLPTGDDVQIDIERPMIPTNDVDVHISAPQSVTISRGEDRRTIEDRIREA